ncbi:MAG: carboxymuconolactone decarboxylase family protein [Mariprofundales bacterium]|nr:carboxymuconolactone decarboxylase family protein [Mariprofundales bacterium]
MSSKYPELTTQLSHHIGNLHKTIPTTAQAFSNLAQAATANGALDQKTKEFIALGIGVATHCEGCIGFHTKKLLSLGATREEVMEVLGVTIYMGGGPALMYAAEAEQAFTEFAAAV